MATHVMAECYEGDLPPDLELVLVFEEDDVVLTWPEVDPSFQVPQPLSDEDPHEGMMPPQGWTVDSVMALSNSMTAPSSEPSPPPCKGPAHRLNPAPAQGTSSV